MKAISTTLTSLLLCCLQISATPIPPVDLYQRLCGVNAEWESRHSSFLSWGQSPRAVPSNDEMANDPLVPLHLQAVEATLRSETPAGLSAEQQTRRLRHLDVLHRYWTVGKFPVNHYHPTRQPYFQDNFGTLCAVGYLLWHDGQQPLVQQIRRENNYGYLHDLAGQYPAIGTWASANGFTVSELAWIQPTYIPTPDMTQWGNGQGLSPGGRINAMATDGWNYIVVAGKFSSIQGVAASNIARWDGQQWKPVASGVVGEVLCLASYGNKLYLGGDFHLPGKPEQRNVAVYDIPSDKMTALQTGDMGGQVLAINTNVYGQVFMGGDFEQVNGQPMPYLARIGIFGSSNFWNNADGKLTPDKPVRAFALDYSSQFLLVGGDFKTVGGSQASQYLAYWSNDDEDWTTLLPSCPVPAQAVARNNGYIHVGNGGNVHTLDGGLWQQHNIKAQYDGQVHGFLLAYLPTGNRMYAFGGIENEISGIGYLGSGMTQIIGSTGAQGFVLSDNTIRAAVRFKNDTYLAGDFTNISGTPLNGLGIVRQASSSTYESPQGPSVQAISSPDRLTLNIEETAAALQLMVCDVQGRVLHTERLRPGTTTAELETNAWPSGLYFWTLHNGAGAATGKWAIFN